MGMWVMAVFHRIQLSLIPDKDWAKYTSQPWDKPCPQCGALMATWEGFNGACFRCKEVTHDRRCNCPGATGHSGWHYDEEGTCIERCPAYVIHKDLESGAKAVFTVDPENPLLLIRKVHNPRNDALREARRKIVGE